MKEYTFISVEAVSVQAYLMQRAREGYVLVGQFPCRKEIIAEGDKTIETTISFYITMEREAPTPTGAESSETIEIAKKLVAAKKAVDRFGPEGPKNEEEWKEFEAMGGIRPTPGEPQK